MIKVALASGFGSVRRFNETFQQMYGRPPSKLRRHNASGSAAAGITIFLPYRPPYDWATMLRFLDGRAIAGVEVVTKDSYSRVVEFGDEAGSIPGWHAPEQSSLRVTVRFPRLDVLPTVITRIRRQFDFGAEPNAIAAALSSDPVLAPMVAVRPGLRVPGGWDGFEIAVRAVLGQQITVQAATRLAGRIVAKLGAEVSEKGDAPGLTHVFPRPERFGSNVLAKLGMPKARAASLAAIAAAVIADPQLFDPRRDLDDAVARLKELPGIGEWTAQYIAMRALGESDAFLAADIGLQRSVAKSGKRPTTQQLLARAERWRPWRAYATLHLWMAEAAKVNGLAIQEKYDALTA
jgi:AraC family transcriptional regulator of adaptative response / DNA-3-methyladenine glycosylase II